MQYKEEFQKNLESIRHEIENACAKSGRKVSDVALIAVSKTQPVERIRAAMDCGLSLFGESRAQELEERFTEIGSLPEIHFIGHLQRNKIPKILPYISAVHSIDKIETATELDKQCSKIGKKISVLVEANTSGEESKSGVRTFSELLELAETISKMGFLDFRGLMTMAPYGETETVIRTCFARLREWRDKLGDETGLSSLTWLSMGMSDDFSYAIKEGSTMVRIGTKLFGGRDA